MVVVLEEDRLRDRLAAVHRIVARAGTDTDASREELLAEALAALDLEFGTVTQIRDGVAYPTSVLARVSGTTPVDKPVPLADLLASVVAASDATFASADLAAHPVLHDHVQVREREVRAYVGTPIRAGGDYFVLTMGATRPRESPFASEDLAYVELLAALFAQSLRHEMQERSIERLAHHCRLTGFPLETRLRERLEALAAAGSPFALLALDIDIARILAEYDYAVFSRVAAAAARRLETIAAPPLALYRGHECDFFILLPEESRTAIAAVADDVRRVLALPFALDGREIGVSAAIGIATSPSSGEPADATMLRAVAAVREARAGSRMTTRVAPADDAASRQRTRLLDELRSVAERDEAGRRFHRPAAVRDARGRRLTVGARAGDHRDGGAARHRRRDERALGVPRAGRARRARRLRHRLCVAGVLARSAVGRGEGRPLVHRRAARRHARRRDRERDDRPRAAPRPHGARFA